MNRSNDPGEVESVTAAAVAGNGPVVGRCGCAPSELAMLSGINGKMANAFTLSW